MRTFCRVVGHTGEWTSSDARCVRARRCERRGDITTEEPHAWSAFGYVAAHRCEQERRRRLRGVTELRVLHEWGPWSYVGRYQFLLKLHQVHTCGRCGAEEQTEFERAF